MTGNDLYRMFAAITDLNEENVGLVIEGKWIKRSDTVRGLGLFDGCEILSLAMVSCVHSIKMPDRRGAKNGKLGKPAKAQLAKYLKAQGSDNVV